MIWAGVDVGGPRKGFHAVALDALRIVDVFDDRELRRDHELVVEWLRRLDPALTAVDSPRSPAPRGHRLRDGEKWLNADVCGIRWTPDFKTLCDRPDYYSWILHGLKLYEALREAGLPVIECFPTASWTRWAGTRGSQTRARWTREALPRLGLLGIPERTNQDIRDAIAAALTARLHGAGLTESFGEIVVPHSPDLVALPPLSHGSTLDRCAGVEA